jgi:hypothetical protein
VKSTTWFKFEVYALAGFSALWYDPRGKKDGKWYGLAALNTEGQGQPNGIKDYSKFTAVIPYGIGIRRRLSGGRNSSAASWSISLEITMRKTFSDYIDDVSDVYYDSDGIGFDNVPEVSAEAIYFGDPSGLYTTGGFGEDQQRGGVLQDDSYMLGMVSISYIPGRRRRNLPKF